MPAISPTWTTERIELLKRGFDAGMSCREIAADIGVSRNAVIGKLSRLNLTREDTADRPRRPRKAAGRARPEQPAPRRQYQMLVAFFGEPRPAIEDKPIEEGHRCTLFELSDVKCRWPISTPGAEDFCFCGNLPASGLPYCPGHSRLAYRLGSR